MNRVSIVKTISIAVAVLTAVSFAAGCSTTNAASKNPEFIGNFDPEQLGTGSLLIEEVFGKNLIPQECTMMLYPKDGTAGILFKNELNKNKLLLNKAERTALIDAIMQYADDFENKRLDVSVKKPSDCYGKINPRIEWGPFQYNGYALPKVTFSYVFYQDAPYFCINIPMTKSPERKGDLEISFNGCTVYLTLSQCEEMVTALRPETIDAVAAAHSVPADKYAADVYGTADVYNSADTENSAE